MTTINSAKAYDGSGFKSQLNQGLKNDGKLYKTLSDASAGAKGDYFKALAGGNDLEIAEAKDKYQSYQVAMQAALEFSSNKFRMMMEIIRKLAVR